MWAVKKMQNGRKCRRLSWGEGWYAINDSGHIVVNVNDEIYDLDVNDILATDWEVVRDSYPDIY